MVGQLSSLTFPFGCNPYEIVQCDGYPAMTARNAVMLVSALPVAERMTVVIFRRQTQQPSILTISEINVLARDQAFMSA